MLEVGKKIRRSKSAVLESLKLALGHHKLREITRNALIDYGKWRAKQGAGPATVAIDISFIGTVLTHAAAVHGIAVSPEEVKLARVALKRLDLVGDPQERTIRGRRKIDRAVRHRSGAAEAGCDHDLLEDRPFLHEALHPRGEGAGRVREVRPFLLQRAVRARL